jgi:hypothetical protein
MSAIIAGLRLPDNRDVPVTPGHRGVVAAGDAPADPELGAAHRRARTAGQENHMRTRITAALTGALLLVSVAATTVSAGGPPSLGFYVDGSRYRTIGTPTDFTNTGAPDFSFDKIYALGSGLINVAEAKPGDTDFNGGRWMVLPITWNVTPVQLTSAEAVQAYADAGWLTIGTTPVREFFCPVVHVPGS